MIRVLGGVVGLLRQNRSYHAKPFLELLIIRKSMTINIISRLSVKGLPEDWRFPTTRYRGSKRRILPWIWSVLKELPFDSALDLFGGTASVSLLLKRMGKKVVFNDYLRFNYFTGVAFVQNRNVILSEDDIDFILASHKSILPKDFIAQTFHRHYYYSQENAWLDRTVANIFALREHYKATTLQQKQALAFWALGQACLIKRPFNLFHRKNLSLRVRSATRNFGNKTTWETPFSLALRNFANEANAVVFDNGHTNRAICTDGLRLNQNGYGLVYLDPPYFSPGLKETDYRDLYHFLEGLARYDAWPDMIDYSTYNLRLSKNGINWPSNTPEKLAPTYDAIIEKFSESIIVISHKSGGTISVGALKNMLSKHGKQVRTYWKRHIYALSKGNRRPRSNIEWLILGL